MNMAKILDDKALDEILNEVANPLYFFQKAKEDREDFKKFYEKDGSVVVTFLTGIAHIEPNEEDLAGKIWIPRLKDDDNNPILDRSGNPRQPWDKFEAKSLIRGNEIIYGFGGKNGVQFTGFIKELKKNDILNKDLSGTKWKFRCTKAGKFNKWDIEYLGTEDIEKLIPKETPKPESSVYDKVINGIEQMKNNSKPMILKGLSEEDLVSTVSYLGKIDEKEVTKLIPELEKNEVIKITNGKIYVQ